MARRGFPLDLDEQFAKELRRVASELGSTPGEAVEQLLGDLSHASFASGVTVATAEGTRRVITYRSIQVG